MDSDSDNDILTNNVFTFQNRNMTVCAKGPNIANSTSMSFHNKVLSSTMHMPRNMEHSRYAGSVYEQRSIYTRREVSPMSVRSAYDFQPRNFNMSHYPRGMSSQRSIMNGRSGSPMSMTSTASVSAVDIAMAFKNDQFNKHDLKIISEAYHKYVKRKIRKKYEKRRNLRLFLKGARRRSGGESGEQGSDSSISNDDCQSNKTSLFKENMSSCRSTRTDLTDIRRTMQESNIYNDCSANFKQKAFKNAFSIDSGSFNTNISSKPQNTSSFLKDRFKSGFVLPSQRFNRSVAASTIPENVEKITQNKNQKPTKEYASTHDKRSKNFMSTDSEHEEIFSNNTVIRYEKETQPKRNLEKDDETHTPHKKRCKLSPIKKICEGDINDNNQIVQNKEEFVFAKPSFPIKKVSNLKVKERLISKSPNVNNVLARNEPAKCNNALSIQDLEVTQEIDQIKEPLESTDVSMRPSFIKRKLFTQKMDVGETKNLSTENLDSPKTVYSAIQKEKHKARKLVTNQSCLTRDVLQEDNLLDLIHKIVPAEKINSTNQTNRSDTQRKSKDVDDNWDIASVLSNINKDDVSDTYTDEDIFNSTRDKLNNKKGKKSMSKDVTVKNGVVKNIQKCQVLIERIVSPAKNMQKDTKAKNNPKRKGNKENEINAKSINAANPNQNNIKTCVKSFWDTDLESDIENLETVKRINTPINIQKIGPNKRTVDQLAKKLEPKKVAPIVLNNTVLNNTTASVQKFNKTTLGIRSHRAPKKKKCCEELDQTNATIISTQRKDPIQKKNTSYSAISNNVKPNNITPIVPENKSKNGRAIRSCRTPKQTPKEITQNQNKKTNKKTEVQRTLRPRKSDLSNSSLNDSIITRSQAKKNKKS